MKMFKFVFALISLLIVTIRANPLNQPRTTFEIIELEEACVQQGGLCMHPDDCAPGSLASLPGLCPSQMHRGIQCCYV